MPKPAIAIDTEMFRVYRKRAELSQKALAEKSRLSPSQVSRIEGGKVNPLFDTVNVLAAAMGTGAHRWVADEQEYTRLMTEDDPWEFVPEWILELGLDPEQLEALEDGYYDIVLWRLCPSTYAPRHCWWHAHDLGYNKWADGLHPNSVTQLNPAHNQTTTSPAQPRVKVSR